VKVRRKLTGRGGLGLIPSLRDISLLISVESARLI